MGRRGISKVPTAKCSYSDNVASTLGPQQPLSIRRVAGASAINVAYLVIQSVLFVILTPIMLRVFGKDLYGLWVILLAVMGVAGLAHFKTISAVVKYTAQFTVTDPTGRKLSGVLTVSYALMLVAGLLTSGILWLSSEWIASTLGGTHTAKTAVAEGLVLLAIGLTPLFLSEVSIGILLGMVKNVLCGGLIVAHHVLLWVGALAVGSQGGDIGDLGLWITIVNISRFLTTALAALWVTRSFQLRMTWNVELGQEVLSYIAFTWVGYIGLMLFNSLDRVFVGMALGATAAGVYGIATSVGLRLTMLADQLTQVLVPYASSCEAHGRSGDMLAIFRHSSRVVACAVVMAAGLIVIWMELILSIWISPEFSSSYARIFSILVASYAAFSVYRPAHQILLGLGRLHFAAAALAGSAVGMLCVLWVLMQMFGLGGAAIANLAFVSVIAINVYLARRISDRPWVTVISDLGPPMLVLVSVMCASSYDISYGARSIMTGVIVIILGLLAVSGGRAQLLMRVFRTG